MEKTEFEFEQGISINEIIKKIDALHAVNAGWRVLIDDEIVTDFSSVPNENEHVCIKLVPEGDNENTGTGMKIGGGLAVLGGIIAIATLGWTGVGGVLGAALIGAGVGCFAGGVVLYNIDIPSVTTNRKNQEAPEQDPSIRGSQNQMRPYGVVPTLFGKRRIYTDLASKSYTWSENGAVYLYQLFCVGQKDMVIDKDSIKIDETLLKDYSSTKDINSILAGNDPLLDMRIHQDGTMPVLYDKCVHEEQINSILKHETEEGVDGSIIRTTPDKTEEINVDVFFYNGLGKYNDNGSIGETSVELGVWYKEKDEPDSAYKPLYFLSEPHTYTATFRYVKNGGERVNADNIWKHFDRWERINGDEFVIDSTNKSKYLIKVMHDNGGYWDIPTFTVSYTEESPGSNVISGSELKTKRYSITKSGLEAASYTVKISRITADSTDTKVIDDVYVGSIRAAKNENPVRPERASQLTIVELKIKASEKLNQVVKQLNFIAESKLPVYSGNGSGSSKWSDSPSCNPASAAIYAMQGGFAQQKLSDSEIDWPAFEKLYTWCEAHKYKCNAYITESMPISGLLNAIASTCRAEIVRLNGKITVIQDITRDSFVQVFTPRNSHDYSENIALSDVPDALNLNFIDSENGYAQGLARIYNTPNGNYAGEPETTQDVELWGVTNSEQARKLGMYKYAVTNHRTLIHRFSVDFEYLMCTKGDWIKYAGDIALAGITQGRIQEAIKNAEGLVIGVMCDEEIPMESGKSYAVRIRKSTGEIVLFDVQNTGKSSHTLILQEAISIDSAPAEGNLFTFGERGYDSIDLIVTDIQCGENLSAELICVEYAPEIFGVDSPGFVLPDYENKLSAIPTVIDKGDVSGWRTWTTYNDNDLKPFRPTGDGTSGGWHRSQTVMSKWVSTKTAENIYAGSWSEPSPTGELALERILGGEIISEPDTVTGLNAVAGKDSVSIYWNPPANDGLKNAIKQYAVEISFDGGENWEKISDVYQSFASYTLDHKNGAYYEASAFSAWRVRVLAENVYGKKSVDWATVGINTASYGTWIPAVPNFTLKEADEGGINLAWTVAKGANDKELYGKNIYRVSIFYDDTERKVIETEARNAVYDFVRNVDGYPEKPTVTGAAVTLDKYTVRIEVINESQNTAASTKKPIDFDNYKTWIPHLLEGIYAVRSNAAKRVATLLFPPQSEIVYGNVLFGVTVSRRNTDRNGETQLFYTPNITKDCYIDINSYKDETDTPIFCSGSFKQNLPLLGQDMRSIQLDRHDVDFRNGEAVKDENNQPETYAISREYYVYDTDGIEKFREIYGIHSGINIDSILEQIQNETVNIEWVREGGTESDYTKCYMTVKLIATPMPDETEYIYRVIARNTYGNAASAPQDINILATSQSAADLVDKAITSNKLADQCVTTEKIAAGAITAEEIAAVNLLAKGATAGNMTAEGLQVPQSGFWAGKTMRYDYTAPDGTDKTYTAEAGEFFVGNNPDHESSPTDDDEYLHFVPRTKKFFLAIKNIVFQSLATIIKGVFLVKNSLADLDENAFMTVNPTNSAINGTQKKTVNVKGDVTASLFNGNLNGTAKEATDLTPENTPHYFRDRNSTNWAGGTFWGTSGSEAWSFIVRNATTRFQFVIESAISDWVSDTWSKVTSAFEILKDRCTINGHTVVHEGNIGSETAGAANKLAITGMSNSGFSFAQTFDAFHGASDWAHYLISNHGDGESYFNYILRLPFWGTPQYQRQTGSAATRTRWFDFITSENIRSQTVEHAATADSAEYAMFLRQGDAILSMSKIAIITAIELNDSRYGYVRFSNGLLIQWLKEYRTTADDTWITLPIGMTSTNYVILDGRQGYNLADTTGWRYKETGRFCVNTENAHTSDFLIVGY